MVKTIETRHQHDKTTKGGAGGDRDEGNRGKVMPPLITEKPLDESGAGGGDPDVGGGYGVLLESREMKMQIHSTNNSNSKTRNRNDEERKEMKLMICSVDGDRDAQY